MLLLGRNEKQSNPLHIYLLLPLTQLRECSFWIHTQKWINLLSLCEIIQHLAGHSWLSSVWAACLKRIFESYEKVLCRWARQGQFKCLVFFFSLKNLSSSGQVAQLFRALSPYDKVVGLIPHQGTYKNHPMNT